VAAAGTADAADDAAVEAEGSTVAKVTAEAIGEADKGAITDGLPFIANATTPELGEELFGLATIVLNAALMGVDDRTVVAEAGTGFEPVPPLTAAGGVVTSGAPTTEGGTEATGDAGTLLTTELTLICFELTLVLLEFRDITLVAEAFEMLPGSVRGGRPGAPGRAPGTPGNLDTACN